MQYQSPSVEAFVQRIVHLAGRGYFRFFTGEIPEHANPYGVDAKLAGKYGLKKSSKASRARRKARGLSNLYYFRHERFFIVMATAGEIESRPGGEDPWATLRESSVCHGPYEVFIASDGFKEGGAKREKVKVRLREEVFRNERAYLLDLSLRRERAYLEAIIFNLPYNCYAPVRAQVRSILDEMNEKRKRAGYEKLSPGCIRFQRDRPKHLLEEGHTPAPKQAA